jgi:hypothetical protein
MSNPKTGIVFCLYGKERFSYVVTGLGNGACIWEARFIIVNCMERKRFVQLGWGILYAVEKGSQCPFDLILVDYLFNFFAVCSDSQ